MYQVEIAIINWQDEKNKQLWKLRMCFAIILSKIEERTIECCVVDQIIIWMKLDLSER